MPRSNPSAVAAVAALLKERLPACSRAAVAALVGIPARQFQLLRSVLRRRLLWAVAVLAAQLGLIMELQVGLLLSVPYVFLTAARVVYLALLPSKVWAVLAELLVLVISLEQAPLVTLASMKVAFLLLLLLLGRAARVHGAAAPRVSEVPWELRLA